MTLYSMDWYKLLEKDRLYTSNFTEIIKLKENRKSCTYKLKNWRKRVFFCFLPDEKMLICYMSSKMSVKYTIVFENTLKTRSFVFLQYLKARLL